MINKEEDRVKYLGITIFIVLCFLLLHAFHQNSMKPEYSQVYHFHTTTSLAPKISSNNSSEFFLFKNSISQIDKINFWFNNEHLRVKFYNKLVNQKFDFLYGIELYIKPIISIRFYNYSCFLYSEDLPVLS